MHYRRVYIEGGSYFFTVITEKRRKIFADDDNVKRLRAAFKTVMQKRPFVIAAAVVLPDHLHFIWTLPEHDSDYSTRWRLIKTAFTKKYPRINGVRLERFDLIQQIPCGTEVGVTGYNAPTSYSTP
jgi:putative transposase